MLAENIKKKTVHVQQGILEGELLEDYAVFRGVPYAKPPVGSLRFRAPKPPEAWEGVRQAISFGNRCTQLNQQVGFYGKEFYSDASFLPPMSEDCLYLNIWTPCNIPEGGCPVAFWIHGGAFQNGFGSEPEFDGAEYARRGVILVTINYRLGALGFLALQELAEEDSNHSTGNYGILDQIAALKWVRENICAFGGNRDRITLMGQSAGARSVQTLVSSPLAKGMFAGAIMQSGGGIDNSIQWSSTEKAYEIGKQMMKLCHVKTLEELRSLPAEIFLKKHEELSMWAKGLPYSPIQDGYVMCEDYDTCAREGRIADVPYLLGSNSQDLDAGNQIDDVRGALYEGCTRWAIANEKNGGHKSYVYYFRRHMPGDKAGAFHSAELWYMFGTLRRCWRPIEEKDYELSREMLDYWTTFIKTGTPEGAGEWRACTEKDLYVKEFI